MTRPNPSESKDVLLHEQHEGYAVVTINRAHKRNAANTATQQALLKVLTEGASQNRALILTATGDTSFCAGVDITERSNLGGTKAASARRAAQWDSWLAVQEAILSAPMVVIAGVNGYALGGGVTLVNCCDLAIAAEHAEFGIPELKMGVVPALSGPSTLARIPPKNVAFMAFTTGRIDASMAKEWGLVNEVHAAANVLDRCHELARRIAAFDGAAVDFTKKLLRDAARMDVRAGMEHGLAIGAVLKSLRAPRPTKPSTTEGCTW
jgi:enoyl-CoA hydratase/carnithine racemase